MEMSEGEREKLRQYSQFLLEFVLENIPAHYELSAAGNVFSDLLQERVKDKKQRKEIVELFLKTIDAE